MRAYLGVNRMTAFLRREAPIFTAFPRTPKRQLRQARDSQENDTVKTIEADHLSGRFHEKMRAVIMTCILHEWRGSHTGTPKDRLPISEISDWRPCARSSCAFDGRNRKICRAAWKQKERRVNQSTFVSTL